jgi:hypothetical protein
VIAVNARNCRSSRRGVDCSLGPGTQVHHSRSLSSVSGNHRRSRGSDRGVGRCFLAGREPSTSRKGSFGRVSKP